MRENFRFIEKYCRKCGKRLTLKNDRDIIRKNFCNRICRGNGTRQRKKEIGKKCLVCNKTFLTYPSLNRKYCSMGCWKARPIKPRQEKSGYIVMPDRETKRVRVGQHILIAEKVLGRRLKNGEIVHHINLNKSDNRNLNLLICTVQYHKWLHCRYQLCYAELYMSR